VTSVRVGLGFDVHRFTDGRPLVLCGLEIEGEPGLDGHSDADVALHAVCDALLGAVAGGDLGEHFPSSDPRWAGASSAVLLHRVLELVAEAGYTMANCDLTLIGARPRIAPRRSALRSRLAELVGIDRALVSIKATTNDGLGLVGRGEGLAAMAVVLVEEVETNE
jgi:2-C-methyl-D-erythritol 2,4-cyclodiphosphate synthase